MSLATDLKMEATKLLGLIYFWGCRTPVGVTVTHLGMLSATVGQWYQYFCDICSWKLLQVPMWLGGCGRVVQMDESVIARAEYNRGSRLAKRTKWVFGIYDPVSKVGYVQIVPNRSTQTLRQIIWHVMVPGTEIWTDEWLAYRMIRQMGLGYVHRTVNHGCHFRDPVTGVCMNHVEAYWLSLIHI